MTVDERLSFAEQEIAEVLEWYHVGVMVDLSDEEQPVKFCPLEEAEDPGTIN